MQRLLSTRLGRKTFGTSHDASVMRSNMSPHMDIESIARSRALDMPVFQRKTWSQSGKTVRAALKFCVREVRSDDLRGGEYSK